MAKSEFEADLEAMYGKRPALAVTHRSEFLRGAWRQEDWLMLKCPRFDQPVATWIQQDDHIVNPVPRGAAPEDLMGKLAPDTFATMILRRKFTGPIRISSTMGFDDQMAPLILITPEYAMDARGRPEYRNQLEIVLYNQGLNVWQNTWRAGDCTWRLAAHCKASFQPLTRYRLTVELGLYPAGKELKVTCAGVEFSFFADALPDAFFVGLTACEGVNRFYDFQVESSPDGSR